MMQCTQLSPSCRRGVLRPSLFSFFFAHDFLCVVVVYLLGDAEIFADVLDPV